MTTTTADTSARAAGRRLPARAATIAAAAILAIVVRAVAALVGTDLLVDQGGTQRTVGVGEVAAAALVAGLLGYALLAVLERTTRRARTAWTVVAFAVLLFSLGGPLGSAVTGEARATLILLHLSVGAVLIRGLRKTTTMR